MDSFVEIAGVPRERAQAYLDAANGNLEMALSLYFEGELGAQGRQGTSRSREGLEPMAAAQEAPKSLAEELNSEYMRDLVSASRVAPRVAPGVLVYELRLPFFLKGILLVLDKLVSIFALLVPKQREPTPFFDRVLAPVLAKLGSARAPQSGQLLRGSYNEALERAKSELNFLLVVIVNELDPNADFLARVLSAVAELDTRLYVYATSALTAEGLGIAEAFHATKLPLAALVGASPKAATSSVIVMERLFQQTGADSFDVPSFVAELRTAMDLQEPKLLSLKLNRQQFSEDRAIREEQDSAYQRSLEADRQKAQKLKREREQREKEAQQQQRAEQLERENSKNWVTDVAKRANQSLEPPEGEKAARVAVRLPNGERINLLLPGDAAVLQVYDLVFAHLHRDESPFTENGPPCLASQYGFTLTSTVMRRQLESSGIVRDNDALWPNGVLMVDLD